MPFSSKARVLSFWSSPPELNLSLPCGSNALRPSSIDQRCNFLLHRVVKDRESLSRFSSLAFGARPVRVSCESSVRTGISASFSLQVL